MLASTLKYFRSIVLITCTLLANALQAENVIRTDGVALITSTLDKDIYRTRAIENAFQNLASKGVQTLDSFSIIENGQVLIDQVHLASKLGIQEYRVVKEEIKGKTYHVTLDVVLSGQLNKEKNNLCLRASPPSVDFSIVLEKKFNKMPRIAITGLNPHCENFLGKSEEINIIEPAIKILQKKKIKITGPFPADTIFLEQNYKKFDVVIGMYHDQVLTPLKALKGFSAINITLGLPFLRISPDHGPNYQMIGKNKSDPASIFYAFDFLDKL